MSVPSGSFDTFRYMIEYFKYNGKQYHRYPDSKRKSDARYYRRGRNYLHRVIWTDHHGEIPAGGQIHHINGDFGDNRIENLECVTPKVHANIHAPDHGEARRAHLDNVRHKAAEWHRSTEGREWHRAHGADVYANAHKTVDLVCDHCFAPFTSSTFHSHSRFCSNKCKSAWRRKAGLDDVQRNCEACSRAYTVNRYSKSRSCSKRCAWALRRQPQMSAGPS